MIGTGGVAGWRKLDGWARLKNRVQLTAFCDIRGDVARAQASKFGVPAVYTDFRRMLKREKLDAVDINTPNEVHAPAAVAALRAGLHVLCEKPLATTVRDVDRIAGAVGRGRILMTAQSSRYEPMSRSLKSHLARRPLGGTYHARVHMLRRNGLPISPGFIDKKLAGAGPCFDIGVHGLDTCLWLMDFPEPVRMSGHSGTYFAKGRVIPGAWGEWDRKKFSVEDFAAGFVHFKNGGTLVLETSWLGHHRDDYDFHIFGLKSAIRSDGLVSSFRKRKMVEQKLRPSPGPLAHYLEIEDFVDAILRKKPSPVPVRQTRMVIGILEGIMKSNRRGGEVRLRA